MNRRRVLRTTGIALTVGLAGCGGGGDGTPTAEDDTPTASPSPTGGDTESGTARPEGTPSPDETPTATPEPTTAADETTTAPDETTTPTATPTATPEPAAQVVKVGPEGDSFKFVPDSFEVATGETVRWVWYSRGHNVRVDAAPDGSDWTGTPGGGNMTYETGYTHEHTFTTAGDYAYYCKPHRSLGMEGSFTVTA